MDHLAAIKTFLRVAELESFSEAARQLGLPKSLVTERVNYLEQHLGTPLLARTTRRVRLTESGSLYQPRALALVEELEALEQSLGEAHVQLRGLVRVSSPTSFGVRYLGPALDRASGRLPEAQFADIRYADLLADPIAAAAGVYDQFAWDLPPSTSQAMADYLAARPQGKHGIHRYALEDFGLDPAEERARFLPYQQHFRVPDEP